MDMPNLDLSSILNCISRANGLSFHVLWSILPHHINKTVHLSELSNQADLKANDSLVLHSLILASSCLRQNEYFDIAVNLKAYSHQNISVIDF